MRARRRALGLAGLVVALALAEWLLGGPLRPELHDLRDADWQARTRRMQAALHRADEELVYVPRPGAGVEMDYGRAAFDEAGRRAGGPPAPAGAARTVVVLGDSLVWGDLLAAEDTVPAALQGALGEGYAVWNLGVSGYDTVQEAGWYRRAGRPLHPDVVVLVYCLNDMLLRSGPGGVHGGAAFAEAAAREAAWLDARAPLRNETVNRLWWAERGGGGSQVLAALRHVGRWHRLHTLPGGYVDDYLLAARDPARDRRVGAALASLGADLRADGARPVLVISPALYWWHRYQWDDLHATVRALGEAAGFTVVDPIQRWRGQDPEGMRFPGDNLHYTAAGARRLAAEIAPVVSTPR